MRIEKQRYFDIIAGVWERNQVSSRFQQEINAVLQKIWFTPETEKEENAVSFFQLPILCAEAVGGTTRQIEQVAAAWSLLYSALYLLDKIEDNELAQLPFHPDAPVLTNITTGLLATVELILDDLEIPGRSGQDLAEIRAAFHRCLITMCAGQSLGFSTEPLTLEESWEVAAGKSGVFFGLGCFLGAFVCTGDRSMAERFYQYGHALGLLVQIEDDLDGLWGKPNKPSDLAQGSFSLPVAYACSALSGAQADELLSLLQNAKIDYNAEEAARSMALKNGALLYLYLEAEKQKRTAVSALENVPLDTATRDTMVLLLDRLDMQRFQRK